MTDRREIRAVVGVKRASLLKRMFKYSSEVGEKSWIIWLKSSIEWGLYTEIYYDFNLISLPYWIYNWRNISWRFCIFRVNLQNIIEIRWEYLLFIKLNKILYWLHFYFINPNNLFSHLWAELFLIAKFLFLIFVILFLCVIFLSFILLSSCNLNYLIEY